MREKKQGEKLKEAAYYRLFDDDGIGSLSSMRATPVAAAGASPKENGAE
jgi:hypothetical protein